MLRSLSCLVALMLLAPHPTGAEILEIPSLAPTPLVPAGWSIVSKTLSWDSQGLMVRARTEGNCRIEYEEVCYPAPGGGTICRKVPHRVCDEAVAKLRFGPELVMVQDRWAYLVRDQGAPVVFGEGFKVITGWSIVTFRGATLKVDVETGASLTLDTEVLGQGRRQAFFEALYPTLPCSRTGPDLRQRGTGPGHRRGLRPRQSAIPGRRVRPFRRRYSSIYHWTSRSNTGA